MIEYIEIWWKHNGAYDREQASGMEFDGKDMADYLTRTDHWWQSLTDEQKKQVYEDYFEEC